MISATPLALTSAVLHASWNFAVKRAGAPRAATLLTLTFALVFALGVLVATGTWHAPIAWRWALMAGLGEAVYVIALGAAMARGDMGVTYTVSRATAMVCVWPISFCCFGSVPSRLALVATAFVFVGVLLCRPNTSVKSGRIALVPTLLSGLGVGVYHSGYKGSVLAGTPTPLTFVVALLIALPPLWLLLFRSLRSEIGELLRTRTPLLLGSGAASCGSFLLAVYALERSESGRVLGLRNASVGVALLFALVLGERLSPRQWAGIACLGASIPLFSLG